MKKLFIVSILAAALLMLEAVSMTFAQTNKSAIKVMPVEPTGKAVEYVPSTGLMKELDELVKESNEAEEKGDKESAEKLYQKIHSIKQEINKQTKAVKAQETVEISAKPVYIERNKCSELKDWEAKKVSYEELYVLSEEELKAKGYSQGKEEVRKVITELKTGIDRLRKGCEEETTSIPSVIAQPVKPVVVESGEEIINYYKVKIGEVASEEINKEEKVVKLKELRQEIDELIRELIKAKDELNSQEIQELVEEVKVKAGEIKADNVVVKTTGKKMITTLNEKSLEIKPTKKEVIIKDKEVEVKAKEITINSDGTMMVGNSEVKLTPTEIIEKIEVEPKEIELVEENNKAVYKVQTQEKRRLFGFIPIGITKIITTDAVSAEVLKEKLPWWAFLARTSKTE